MSKVANSIKPKKPAGVFSLKQWCQKNGYDGVTRQCVISARSSENEKVREWAKDAMVRNIARSEPPDEDL